jgi:hypothetical protein
MKQRFCCRAAWGGTSGVGGGAAPADAEILDVVRAKAPSCGARRGDGEEVGAVDVLKVKRGARVGRGVGDFDVAHFEIANVAQEESRRRHLAKHAGLGIGVFFFGWLELGASGVAPPAVSTKMFESLTSSIAEPGIPLRMELMRMGALWQLRLLMRMRLSVPTLVVSLGPRRRAPRRMKSGPEMRSRMVVLVMVMSSSSAPSTVSSA